MKQTYKDIVDAELPAGHFMTAILVPYEHSDDPDLTAGDHKNIWDRGVPEEVEAAHDLFRKWRKKGYMAYKVSKDGSKGELMHEFDADAEKIIFAPALQGG